MNHDYAKPTPLQLAAIQWAADDFAHQLQKIAASYGVTVKNIEITEGMPVKVKYELNADKLNERSDNEPQ